MSWTDPFHEGEREAQRLAGEAAKGESNGAMIGAKIMSGAMSFIRAQRMVVVSSRSAAGQRWTSVLFGKAGFLEPGDRNTLTVAVNREVNDATDPLWENLKADGRAGTLMIDPATRRRLRVNGPAHFADGKLVVRVEETYANCPQYITRREIRVDSGTNASGKEPALRGKELGESQTALLATTDVLLLATGHPERGADASHRGGNPGFVQVLNTRTLRIPDYRGNSMFNSLGNLLVDPHFGMLVPDFRRGIALQIAGTARILWAAPENELATGGTNRFVEFCIEEWREQSIPAGVISDVLEYSPFNPA